MSLQQGGGKMAPVDLPYTPIVSTAIGSNWCVSARAAYLRRLHPSELFAAVPASIADLFRRTPAKVSTHVQSQTKLLPPLNGKTLQLLSQAPLSFCAVAINLALDTWSAFNNILSQFLLTIGKSQAFWRFRSSGKEAPPLAPLQDSTASASSLMSALLILERIVTTNSPTELIEVMKEGRAIYPALLHPRPPKLTGKPGLFTRILF